MIRKNLFYFLVYALIVSLYSCETPPPCEDANGVQANVGFYYYSGTTLNKKSIDSLVVYTTNDLNTPYYDGTKYRIDTIDLPLSMLNDTSVFIFHFGTDGTDTVEFYYTQYTRLVSYECGFINFYNLTGIKTTNNLIDSVWIRKELVEYGDEENVKIYF